MRKEPSGPPAVRLTKENRERLAKTHGLISAGIAVNEVFAQYFDDYMRKKIEEAQKAFSKPATR